MTTLSQTTATLEVATKATKNGVNFHAESLSNTYVEYHKVSMKKYIDQLAYNLNQRNERKQLVICKSDILGFYNDKEPVEGFMYLGNIIFTSGFNEDDQYEYWYPLSHAALLIVMTYKIVSNKRFAITYNGSNTKGSKCEKELKAFAKAVKDWVKANPEKAQELCKNVVIEV